MQGCELSTQVGGSLNGYILGPTSQLLLVYETHTQLVQDGDGIPIEVVATSLVIFGAHVNIYINKVKIRVLRKWSYSLIPLCMLIV